MIQMTEKEYLDFQDDRNKLRALEMAGVDNWEGYDDAMGLLGDEEDDFDPEDAFDDDDFLKGFTCNPDAPEECESCQ